MPTVLPRVLVPVDCVDREESGREQLLAMRQLRRDVVPRPAQGAADRALVTMTHRDQ